MTYYVRQYINEIGARNFHCLYDANITDMQELCRMTDLEILNIHGIGREGCRKIREVIEKYKNKLFPTTVTDEDIAKIIKACIISLDDTLDKKIQIIKNEINELRTYMIELHRAVDSLKITQNPNSITRTINEKIPGFSDVVQDIYKILQEKQ